METLKFLLKVHILNFADINETLSLPTFDIFK